MSRYTAATMSALSLRIRIAWLLVLGVCGGCAAARPFATTRPATRPVTTQIQLDSAVLADQLEKDDWELDMQSQIAGNDRTVLFGELTRYDENDKAESTIPVIGYRDHDHLFALKIEDPRLKNAGWSYLCAGPSAGEFWGVLDASLDEKQPAIVFVHSTDGGKTIHLSSLDKPASAMVFDSFCMDAAGHGRVTVYADKTKTRPKRAGYYHFQTDDDGVSWSSPDFEPDAMAPADDAPDDSNKPADKPSRV